MMGGMGERAIAVLIVALLVLAGCGDGDGAGEDAGGDQAAKTVNGDGADSSGERRQLKSHNDSGGGAVQFENARTAGSVVEFGSEAGPEDFEAVAAALHGYLDAKAARDWELSCQYMSAEAIESIAQFDPEADTSDCPALLEQFSSGTSQQILRRLAVADVGSVRIQGNEAHALYTGTKQLGFFMPMVFEDEAWRVRTLAPSMLP